MSDDQSLTNCHEAMLALYLFIDRELPSIECAEIQRHLDECLPCLEAFEFEAQFKQVIARRCRDEVPDALWVRVKLSLQQLAASEQPVNPVEGGIPPQ